MSPTADERDRDREQVEFEDRRSGSDRRAAVEPGQSAGWRDPRFWVALAAFVLLCVTNFWSAARNVAKTEMAIERLNSIDQKLENITLITNSNDKEVQFIKQQFTEFKMKTDADNKLRDTYINNDRERIIKLEAIIQQK